MSEAMILHDEELNEVTGGAGGQKYLIHHTVMPGENLTKIANKYNTTWRKIMKRNPIIKDKNLIRPGWVLAVMVNDR